MTNVAISGAPDNSWGAELSKSKAYRIASWSCLFTALACTAATLAAILTIREGALGNFSPMGVLRFAATHLTFWRVTLFAASAASISFLVFTVALHDAIDRRLRSFMTLAICFATIAVAQALNAHFSMMVLFSDLALQLSMRGGFPHSDINHLSWATMNQSIMQSMLLSNSMNSLVGFTIVACVFRSRNLPSWLAWSGLPIAVVTLNVSIFTFLGALQWSLVLAFAALIAFILWSTTLGLMLNLMARQTPGSQ